MMSSFNRTVACVAAMATMTLANDTVGNKVEGTDNYYFNMKLDENDSTTMIFEVTLPIDATVVVMLGE